MNRPYESYFEIPGNKRFKSFIGNNTLKAIYELMNSKKNIEKMIDASNMKRPALEAVIEEIESLFPHSQSFNLELVYRHRQILGSMCRFILEPYGYYPDKAVKMKKGIYIKTGTIYRNHNTDR